MLKLRTKSTSTCDKHTTTHYMSTMYNVQYYTTF